MLTSDRLPRDLGALEDRLRERFESGLVCDVRPPDLGTRLIILRKRVQQDGVRGVDPDALELIAERVDSNVRALEGALIGSSRSARHGAAVLSELVRRCSAAAHALRPAPARRGDPAASADFDSPSTSSSPPRHRP